jgi:hypothetical protein
MLNSYLIKNALQKLNLPITDGITIEHGFASLFISSLKTYYYALARTGRKFKC